MSRALGPPKVYRRPSWRHIPVAAFTVLLIHSDTFYCPLVFAALSTRRSKSGLNRTGTMFAFA